MAKRNGTTKNVGSTVASDMRSILSSMQAAKAAQIGNSGKIVIGTNITNLATNTWRQNTIVNDFNSVNGARFLYIDKNKGEGNLVQRFGTDTAKEAEYAKMMSNDSEYWVYDVKLKKYL